VQVASEMNRVAVLEYSYPIVTSHIRLFAKLETMRDSICRQVSICRQG
jgi:hypothetical protein